MSAVMVIKTTEGKTLLLGRYELNYGNTRAEQQSLAEATLTGHATGKTLAAFGLGEGTLIEVYIEGGHTQDEILVDGDGIVTLPE